MHLHLCKLYPILLNCFQVFQVKFEIAWILRYTSTLILFFFNFKVFMFISFKSPFARFLFLIRNYLTVIEVILINFYTEINIKNVVILDIFITVSLCFSFSIVYEIISRVVKTFIILH